MDAGAKARVREVLLARRAGRWPRRRRGVGAEQAAGKLDQDLCSRSTSPRPTRPVASRRSSRRRWRGSNRPRSPSSETFDFGPASAWVPGGDHQRRRRPLRRRSGRQGLIVRDGVTYGMSIDSPRAAVLADTAPATRWSFSGADHRIDFVARDSHPLRAWSLRWGYSFGGQVRTASQGRGGLTVSMEADNADVCRVRISGWLDGRATGRAPPWGYSRQLRGPARARGIRTRRRHRRRRGARRDAVLPHGCAPSRGGRSSSSGRSPTSAAAATRCLEAHEAESITDSRSSTCRPRAANEFFGRRRRRLDLATLRLVVPDFSVERYRCARAHARGDRARRVSSRTRRGT